MLISQVDSRFKRCDVDHEHAALRGLDVLRIEIEVSIDCSTRRPNDRLQRRCNLEGHPIARVARVCFEGAGGALTPAACAK